MRRNVKNMAVIISGASAGIGRALAVELSRRGAHLALAARGIERLEALELFDGERHLRIQADVSRPRECESLVGNAAASLGRIDTLVCNAGFGVLRRVVDTTLDEMKRIFDTNLYGTTELIRHAVPIMVGQPLRDGYRGQIVIVSSAAARRGLPFFGPYSATKAAQLSLAEALRVELRGSGVAVTTVHPIGTDTEFHARAEAAGDGVLPPRSSAEVHQSAETVARRIIEGIERPRPEVWPFPLARLALSLATLAPSLADRILAKHRRLIESANKA